MEPDARLPGGRTFDPALAKRIKWGAIALAVVGLAVLAFFLYRAVQDEKAAARWDEKARLEERFEASDLANDPLFEDPGGVYRERRERYIAELERFLPRAESFEDALAPHVHYLIAQLSTDQYYSLRDPLAVAEREKAYERARQHWEILRDRYPDFQINWLEFAPEGHGSITRMVLSVLEANQKWATESFPKDREPATDLVVVLRTERGDMRLGVFREDAPELVDRFVERAVRGEYDGTYFFAKGDQGSDDDPVQRTIRGGHPGVREAKAYDDADARLFAAKESFDGLLPAPARYRIAAARGMVVCWHDPTDTYDGAQQILVCVDRSPQLDYEYTSLGRLLDEPSRATATRIFEGGTWGDRTEGAPPDDLPEIRDTLRVPVRIVKALVYRDGSLVTPTTPASSKAETDASEAGLESLVADAYRVEPPAAPSVPPPDDEVAPPEDATPPGEGVTPPDGDR